MQIMAAVMDSDEKHQLQIELEQLFNKNQLIKRIKKEFTDCDTIPFALIMTEARIDPGFGFDLLVQMALHKRTTMPTLVGILRHHYEGMAAASQVTCDEIAKCIRAGLVRWDPNPRQLIVNFEISSDVKEELDRYQFPLPMVIEPKEVKTNRDVGYLLSRGSIILKKNHHEEDVCLDHINRVNRIKFAIDQDTAFMVRNQWRNLDKQQEGETREDYEKRVRAFEKYDRTSKDVIAKVLSTGNEFYLTHKYDKRGRVYAQGYHINYQGNDWNKAVVVLADKEYVE